MYKKMRSSTRNNNQIIISHLNYLGILLLFLTTFTSMVVSCRGFTLSTAPILHKGISASQTRSSFIIKESNQLLHHRKYHGQKFMTRSKIYLTSLSSSSSSSFSSLMDEEAKDNLEESQSQIAQATKVLSNFDTLQQHFIKSDGSQGMGGGISALTFIKTQLTPNDKQSLRNAILILTNEAHQQRNQSILQNKRIQHGRIMLGICAENVTEGLMGLKTWVTALSLPRGLLHGLDVDGKPMENPETLGSIYLKYNTGGCMTFSEMKKSGLGFDALWKPGDVVLETYDGDFRGIYFNVELEDGVFRQFGVLPTDLFLEEEEW